MKRFFVTVCFIMALCSGALGQEKLEDSFADPPRSARPYVWWHWMNGNVSKEGIRKDLLWMDSVGIAGLQQFDAAWKGVRPVMDRPLTYMSAEWKDCFRYAMDLTDSLGMEVAIAACPGFSSSGGPWVKPEDAMKKLVWRTVEVEGGKKIEADLPEPWRTVGPWQNWYRGAEADDVPEWYQDVAVVAVRIPDRDLGAEDLGAVVSVSGNPSENAQELLSRLNDGDFRKSVMVKRDKSGAWIQYSFPQSVTIRALQLSYEAKRDLARNRTANYRSELLSSDDGITWRNVCRIPDSIVPCLTLDIEPQTGRFFRIRFMERNDYKEGIPVREFKLFTVTKVQHAEGKAGFEAPHDLMNFITPKTADPVTEVIDLSGMVRDGRLFWTAPEGRWRIYRFGASLTGKKNHPTIKDTEGLEVDKFDRGAWSRFFRNYLDLYKEASGGRMGDHGIQYLLNDSYEARQATWTPAAFEEFRSRRGYDLLPWLPALSGEVIRSSDETERFLWDWRKTLGELFAENHDALNGILAEYGLKGRYTESHENGHVYVGDGMDLKRSAAVPMSAFWFHNKGSGPVLTMARADLRESASVAHIYGQNLVAAESFTVSGANGHAYRYYPARLKPLADFAFANGLNRVIIHDSAHQSVDSALPGTGLLRYGQWFNRHETWASMAKPWMDYLARSCYMLQQGRFVADVLVYYGEDNSITGVYGLSWPSVREGYNFDFVSPSALISEVRPKDGKIVTDSGMEYSVLYLGANCTRMSLQVLRKIAALADAGIDICGQPPLYPASLSDSREEFDTLVDHIWNSGRADRFLTYPHEHLSRLGVEEDLLASEPVAFVHRRLDDGTDIYWISNPAPGVEKDFSYGTPSPVINTGGGTARVTLPSSEGKVTLSMRSKNRFARVFNAEDGSIVPVFAQRADGRTEVTLSIGPNDARFVVLSEEGENPAPEKKKRLSPTGSLGEWRVSFQEGRGAPSEEVFPELVSWTEHPDPGIRYFSGTATYSTVLKLGSRELRATEGDFVLNLGTVRHVAEVSVNGTSVGILWRSPWKITIPENLLKKGDNRLEIKVANLWVNRIIGDEQPGSEHFTSTPIRFYSADSPLDPSGLLGPVTLFRSLRNN